MGNPDPDLVIAAVLAIGMLIAAVHPHSRTNCLAAWTRRE